MPKTQKELTADWDKQNDKEFQERKNIENQKKLARVKDGLRAREKASKKTEVECPHCSGKGRMAMSLGYGGGMGTCRNCGGKGKGTEFHYTDTEGNMKKSWESWLEKKRIKHGRRIYPDEGRHGEGGQQAIDNPENFGEKKTGLYGQKVKSWEKWLEITKDQGQGDARYGNPHETGLKTQEYYKHQ